MGILQKLKFRLKTYRIEYVRALTRKKHSKYIKNITEKYGQEIPELTSNEIKEIKDYWAQYGFDIPLEWHRFFYGATGVKDPRYIPKAFFYQVIKPKFNNLEYASIWGDKSYIDLFVRGVRTVRSVVRNVNGRFLDEKFNLIDEDEVMDIMNRHERLVVKPAVLTAAGQDVQLLSAPYNLSEIKKQYKKNFVIQIPLKQHEGMSKLNASSINTIRVNSVLFEKKAHVMSAFIKIGQAGSFADNQGHDRFFVGVTKDGRFADYVIDHDLNKYDSIPSGYAFAREKVPGYDKVCEAVCKAHECIPHFGFAFWDVCVCDDGEPAIVEINLRHPDTNIPQMTAGPFFGEYTDRILNYVISNTDK